MEEDRVESLSQSERRLPFSCIGGALVKEPCRNNIALAEEHVPACQKCCGVRGGKARLRQTCSRRRSCRSAKLVGGRRSGRHCRGGGCGSNRNCCGNRRRVGRVCCCVGRAGCW